ncbi:interleukin-23 receptor isoform X2 [Denticeps clupeoides]|uniref:interleukin-23 receptor isoform X2 n=1 Tax=Denticeps clupeoides TaxID=299321 RepID=UPI0010A51C6A|nr:interleukin-12 receptor subunit beta-2-like isoform X2 [Denticeps clupeoides]
MDLLPNFWSALIVLFNCLIGSAGLLQVNCSGHLTAEPGLVVHRESNLTVYCQTNECKPNKWPTLSLNSDSNLVQVLQTQVNCSTVKLQVINLTAPTSKLLCSVNNHVVCGKDLKSGYPPDKPAHLRCFTTESSVSVNCSWENSNTFLPTTYTVTFQHMVPNKSFQHQCEGTNSITVLRSDFEEDTEYRVDVNAENSLGNVTSELLTFHLKDIEIPSTPIITGFTIAYSKNDCHVLSWNTSGSSTHLGHLIRVRNKTEVLFETDEVFNSSVTIKGLMPMSKYHLEVRVCTTTKKCSMWSRPAEATTPGIPPSRKPDAWRVVTKNWKSSLQKVTVFWKPVESGSYHKLFYEVAYQERGCSRWVNCSASSTQCTVDLPSKVKQIKVTLVTSAGRSPPTFLNLAHADIPPPKVTYNPLPQDSVNLMWAKNDNRMNTLGYVVQWQSRLSNLSWIRLDRECNSTFIRGLRPGVRYNVSLHAETTRGLSEPALLQVYSEQKKPLSGLNGSIKVTKSRQILVQWEELAPEQQRGFITHYSVYTKKHGTQSYERKITVAASSPRSVLLDFEEAGFDLCVSATNAAGEGPRGEPITFLPKAGGGGISEVWLVAALPLMIFVNLMCLKCVRRRLRQTCLTLGPAWLFETLPKPANSNAIRLLKGEQCSSDSFWLPVYSDPPISPVEDADAEEVAASLSYPSGPTNRDSSCPGPAREDSMDPYKPQWTDFYKPHVTSPVLTSDASEMEEEEGPEQQSWQPAPSTFSDKELSFCDLTIGSLSVVVSPDESLFQHQTVQNEFGWRLEEIKGTVLPSELVSCLRDSPVDHRLMNPYSPQGCCFTLAPDQ